MYRVWTGSGSNQVVIVPRVIRNHGRNLGNLYGDGGGNLMSKKQKKRGHYLLFSYVWMAHGCNLGICMAGKVCSTSVYRGRQKRQCPVWFWQMGQLSHSLALPSSLCLCSQPLLITSVNRIVRRKTALQSDSDNFIGIEVIIQLDSEDFRRDPFW